MTTTTRQNEALEFRLQSRDASGSLRQLVRHPEKLFRGSQKREYPSSGSGWHVFQPYIGDDCERHEGSFDVSIVFKQLN